ncbi:DUF7159 family protein [Mycolicibacterium gadium]|uniref:DUF7159 family protein n=1 Tax=Mycolicibacterium gadium TaxID=1794 RepID=UPI001C65E3E1|nr:hypothetical protein [Mycolicibacterium gadium]
MDRPDVFADEGGGEAVETVLGLSVTSSSVGWVLLDGLGVDANTLDHDVFDVATGSGESVDISSHVTAVRGVLAIAAASGHELTSMGLTWTPDAAATASQLLTALPDLGFENIASVRLSEAARTWACAYAGALGFEKAAVCVVEPSAATLLSFGYGAVRTFATHTRENEDGLSRWLQEAFETNHLDPEHLFLVGSRGDLELMSGRLSDALPMSVVTTNEAQLVLARGAALAVRSTDTTAAIPLVHKHIDAPRLGQKLSWFSSPARAAVVLVAGVLFVPVPVLINQPGATSPENQPGANSSTTLETVQAVTVPVEPQPAKSVMKRMAQSAPLPAGAPWPVAEVPAPEAPVTAEPLAVPDASEAPMTEAPEAPVTDIPEAPVAGEPAEVAHLPVPAEVPHLPEQTQHLPDQDSLHLPGVAPVLAAPVLAAEAPVTQTATPSPPPTQAPASPFFAALP